MGETKPCPYCGEPILKVARKCKWCGEWLDDNSTNSSEPSVPCPICGELIPKGPEICPLCKEPIKGDQNKPTTIVQSKYKFNSKHILIGVGALAVVALGTFAIKSHILDSEYNAMYENSPYNIISNNLHEAISNGQTLASFLRDEKNIDALKRHFNEEEYALMLKLGVMSDEPLTSCDPKDNYAGGYAWRTPSEKGLYGCRLILGRDKLDCQYWYDGVEVDEFGNIVRNKHWDCDYYKNEFNQDNTSRPYIEQRWKTKENGDSYFRIRLDNEWGISVFLYTFSGMRYFDKLLLRNNDTGEVWNLPINVVGNGQAVLEREGWQKFYNWLHTAKSLTLSATDSEGDYSPLTATLYNDEMKCNSTFQDHVMKKRIDKSIFVSDGLN